MRSPLFFAFSCVLRCFVILRSRDSRRSCLSCAACGWEEDDFGHCATTGSQVNHSVDRPSDSGAAILPVIAALTKMTCSLVRPTCNRVGSNYSKKNRMICDPIRYPARYLVLTCCIQENPPRLVDNRRLSVCNVSHGLGRLLAFWFFVGRVATRRGLGRG